MLRLRRPSLPKPVLQPGRRHQENPGHGGDSGTGVNGSKWALQRRPVPYRARSSFSDMHNESSDAWKLRRRRSSENSTVRRLVVLALAVALAGVAFGWALLRFVSRAVHPVGAPLKDDSSAEMLNQMTLDTAEGRGHLALGLAGSDGLSPTPRVAYSLPARPEDGMEPFSTTNGSFVFESNALRAGLYPDHSLDAAGAAGTVPDRSDAVAVAQTTTFLIPRGGPYTFVRHHHWPRGSGHDGLGVQNRPPFQTLPSDAYQPQMANHDRPPFAPVVPLRDTFQYLRAALLPKSTLDMPPATTSAAATKPVPSTEQRDGVAVAYILLCHDMDSVAGAGEFLEAVYTHPNLTRFFVHLDAKAGTDVLIALHSIVTRYPRDAAIIVYPRIRVDWGGVSMVKAELLALKAAETLWSGWRFAVIASGTSFPIKSSCEREKWLAGLSPRSNLVFYEDPWKVCHWGATSWDEHCKKQRGRCLDKDCTRMTETPDNGVVYKGPQWVLLSREFSFHSVNSHQSRRWLDYFEHGAHASDEMFFPTLLMNSPFRETYVSKDKSDSASAGMIYVFWNSRRKNGCRSYRSTSPWGWSPCLLGANDFHDIVRSDKQFARKFKAGDPVKKRLSKLWGQSCERGGDAGSLLLHDGSLESVEVDDSFALPWTWRERAFQVRNFVIWAFDGTRDWILGKIDRMRMPADVGEASDLARKQGVMLGAVVGVGK